MTRRGHKAALTLSGVVIALALSAAPANAASTRAEYVAQVDPICHSADLKGRRLARKHHLPTTIDLSELKYGRREGQLTVARQIALNNREVVVPFITTVATIPAPPGDEGVISTWIGGYRLYKRNADRAVHAIRDGKPRPAYRLIVAALNRLLRDIETIRPWGFRYCVS